VELLLFTGLDGSTRKIESALVHQIYANCNSSTF